MPSDLKSMHLAALALPDPAIALTFDKPPSHQNGINANSNKLASWLILWLLEILKIPRHTS